MSDKPMLSAPMLSCNGVLILSSKLGRGDRPESLEVSLAKLGREDVLDAIERAIGMGRAGGGMLPFF